ncbi:hypothetical protein [uncultured Mediterranean phage]|nr:hypothetical protein [uncultured Mediterranean phage]
MSSSSKQILDTLNRIEKKLNEIDKKCDAVNDHANFVEGVYETLRAPLDFITTKVSAYMPSTLEDAPQLPSAKKYKKN